MEIDLLRAGRHVLAFRKERIPPGRRYDSMTCVNRARDSRDLFELYPRLLPERLPRVRVPLADGDPDVVLDIQGVLDRTYETGHYRKIIDYTQPCVPPLRGHNFVWARNLIDQALSKDKPS
jgi:hypothetical protein